MIIFLYIFLLFYYHNIEKMRFSCHTYSVIRFISIDSSYGILSVNRRMSVEVVKVVLIGPNMEKATYFPVPVPVRYVRSLSFLSTIVYCIQLEKVPYSVKYISVQICFCFSKNSAKKPILKFRIFFPDIVIFQFSRI